MKDYTNMNEVIRNHAMLVAYSTTTWPAMQNDRTLARKIEQDTSAKAGAYKLTKNLMAGHDQKLEVLRGLLSEGRSAHNALTLPWGNSQYRMLPVTNWENYTQRLGNLTNRFKEALDRFVESYPLDAKNAREGLGIPEQFHHQLYPSSDQVRGRFSMRVHFEPIASGTKFPGLPDSAEQILAKSFEGKLAAKFRGAIDQHLTEAMGLCDTLLENLKKDKPTFKNAGVLNILQSGLDLKHFNLEDDPDLLAMSRFINQQLTKWDDESQLSQVRTGDPDLKQSLIDDVAELHVRLQALVQDREQKE